MALFSAIEGSAKLNLAQASIKSIPLWNSCLSKEEIPIAFTSSMLVPPIDTAMSLGSKDPEVLAPEVQRFIASTYLAHNEEFPDPNEPIEVLSLYLEGQELLRYRQIEKAIALFGQAIQRFPESRHAHAGLGYALWERYKDNNAEKDLRQAVGEFLRAARIGMKFGKVRYTYQIAMGLAHLEDRTSMDRFFKDALAIGDRKYLTTLDYARGLGVLGDPQAEDLFKQAVALQPEGNIDALAYYAEWLLDHNRPADVVALIDSDAHVEYLHFLRGVALERLGKLEEARVAYQIYAPISELDPAPIKYRIAGSRAQENLIFEGDVVPQDVPCDGYDDLALVIECEAAGESEGGQRAVGWTVRTRVFKGTLANCVYVDNSGTTLECKYSNVIYQPYQFLHRLWTHTRANSKTCSIRCLVWICS